MLIAKDERGNISYADQAMREKDYFCPACREKVFLKRGNHTVAHFSHYAKANCRTFSEGETLEHLKGKRLLYDWFQASNLEVELEPYLKELKQRPDLLVAWEEKRIAVEYQCSPLKENIFIERTKGYLSQNIEVVWILGNSFFNSTKIINAQTKKFIRSRESVLFLMSLDTTRSSLYIWSEFSSLSRKISYKKEMFILDNITPASLFCVDSRSNASNVFNLQYIKEDHLNLTKKRHYNRSPFFHKLYNLRETLISLPLEVYIRLKDDWMIGEGESAILWKLILLRQIEDRGIGTVLTADHIKAAVEEIVSENGMQYLATPLLSEKIKLRPIMQFVSVLEITNCLQAVGQEEWLIKQKAKRFEWEEEKLEKMQKVSLFGL